MAKFSPSEIIPVEIVPWQTSPPVFHGISLSTLTNDNEKLYVRVVSERLPAELGLGAGKHAQQTRHRLGQWHVYPHVPFCWNREKTWNYPVGTVGSVQSAAV